MNAQLIFGKHLYVISIFLNISLCQVKCLVR